MFLIGRKIRIKGKWTFSCRLVLLMVQKWWEKWQIDSWNSRYWKTWALNWISVINLPNPSTDIKKKKKKTLKQPILLFVIKSRMIYHFCKNFFRKVFEINLLFSTHKFPTFLTKLESIPKIFLLKTPWNLEILSDIQDHQDFYTHFRIALNIIDLIQQIWLT